MKKMEINWTIIFLVVLVAICGFPFLVLFMYDIFGKIISAVLIVFWFLALIFLFRYFVVPSLFPKISYNYFTFLGLIFFLILISGFMAEIILGRESPLGKYFVNFILPFLGSVFVYGFAFGLIKSFIASKSNAMQNTAIIGYLFSLTLPQLLSIPSSPVIIVGGILALLALFLFKF